MRNIEIVGYGTFIPENIVKFGNQKRHRIAKDDSTSQIDMAVEAIKKTLKNSNLNIEEIECIV